MAPLYVGRLDDAARMTAELQRLMPGDDGGSYQFV